MAGQGQKVMTQAQLNLALNWACSQLNDRARAEELLGRGADQHALGSRAGTYCTWLLPMAELLR